MYGLASLAFLLEKSLMKQLCSLLFAAFGTLCLLGGCGGYQPEDGSEGSQSGNCLVNLELGNAEIFPSVYPLDIYLFDSRNQCVYDRTVSSVSEIPVFDLSAGSYQLSVFSGLSSGEYVLPLEVHPRQYLTFAKDCCADVPLIAGRSRLLLEKDTGVSVTLSYVVAALYFSFPFFPSDVSEVTLHISPVSSGISLGGDLSNDYSLAAVACEKKGGSWIAGPVYVFPADASRVHLSVKLKQGGAEKIYGYDYNSSFESGKVYRFAGKEDGKIEIGGESPVKSWETGVDVELDLGDFEIESEEDWEKPEDGEDDGGQQKPDSGDGTVLYSEVLPEAEAVWGPFYAWKVVPLSANSVEATLLAPRQWLARTDDARSICGSYEEDGIGGWRPFTLDEAEAFRDQYSATLLELSDFLEDQGFDPFNKYDLRYLCADFSKTFSFENTRILNAGKTVKYGLRLVKVVRVEKAKKEAAR